MQDSTAERQTGHSVYGRETGGSRKLPNKASGGT